MQIHHYVQFFTAAFETAKANRKDNLDSDNPLFTALSKMEVEFLSTEKLNPFYTENGIVFEKTLSQMRREAIRINRKWRGICCALDDIYPQLQKLLGLDFLYGAVRRHFDNCRGLGKVLLSGKAMSTYGLRGDEVVKFLKDPNRVIMKKYFAKK